MVNELFLHINYSCYFLEIKKKWKGLHPIHFLNICLFLAKVLELLFALGIDPSKHQPDDDSE